MMSTTASVSKSKPDRTAAAIAASPKAARLRAKAAGCISGLKPSITSSTAIGAGVPVASIEMAELHELVRAPENVRHIRPDEDVSSLADNIAANGLLQSLIGYRGPTASGDRQKVWIVGGGRRLAALQELLDRGALELDYRVPVLIRPRDQAIELSLSENIEKRDMSPVDEFFAFDQLMKLGTYDEDELAKRFGYTTRYIRQRLRLAQAAPEVLDALAERKITLDSALAYAASQDVKLQAEVFAAQERSTWDQHKPHKISAAYNEVQSTTASPLYLFVGAEAYEAAGGAFEDDLFADPDKFSGARKLAHGHLLLDLAMDTIQVRAEPLEADLRAQYPAYAGFVVPPSAKTGGYPWKAPKGPKGSVLVEADYNVDRKALWKNAGVAAAPITAIVGIDGTGKLALKQDAFFVPKEFVAQVKASPKGRSNGFAPPSQEQIAAERRARDIDLRQWRLGIGKFAGTPLEGRAFWPAKNFGIESIEVSRDPRLQDGRLIALQIYVTNAEHDAMRAEAERHVDEEAAKRAADEAARQARIDAHGERVAEILAMDPLPAIVVMEGSAGRQPWYALPDGEWADTPTPASGGELADGFDTLADLLASAEAGELIETFASIEAYEEARS